MKTQFKAAWISIRGAWRIRANGSEALELVALGIIAAARAGRPTGPLAYGQWKAHARRVASRTLAA